MHAAPGIHLPVPSRNLLRFLKSQAEDLWFFSSNAGPELGFLPRKSQVFSSRNPPNSFPSSPRCLNLGQRCQGTLQSSLLNLDFLKLSPRCQHSATSASHAVTATRTIRNGSHSHRRYASREEQPLLRRLWGGRRRADTSLHAEELPSLPSFLDDAGGTSLGRSKTGKAANELRLRCTEINENGDVTLVNGEFKKSELIAKVRRKHKASWCYFVADYEHSMDSSRATFERSTPPFFPISLYGLRLSSSTLCI